MSVLYERIKLLYEAGKQIDLDKAVTKGMITETEKNEIVGNKK